ncbi:S9 family peptidase [Jiangella alkaliphila]|uniref:Dipeptidyl aminopeptidase/acylaminoacyl peptidase n=1 Tax=Jiangella alkaliphila TaxID=419479 RepID=A0A1H2IT20_9ACTN|nr:prolyl oligopeptidase family serine peptidase [Jiangella alkaliphila]SDU47105.1 Dipeptidyl aminopeptidase/acylaminoacyl peptidase [Jiangella alkaliphila]
MTADLTARYAKAEALLPHHLKELVRTPRVTPQWIGRTETFWYRTRTAEGVRFVVVDAEAGTKRPAFDHERLARALGDVLGEEVDPAALPFFSIDLLEDGAVRVVVGERRIEIALDDYGATVLGPAHPAESPSPDGRWAVGMRDHNLYLRDTATDEERQLTTDGVESYDYATMADSCANLVMQENLGFTMPPLVVWSPDSTRFVTHRLDQRRVGLMHLLRSAPPEGGFRPKPMAYRYAVVGDTTENLATSEYFVFEAATGAVTRAAGEPFLTPFVPTIAYGFLWWSADGATVYFLSSDLGDHTARLNELDPGTGAVTVLVEETSTSHILHGPQQQDSNVRVTSSGEALWWSRRSGHGHLYRYGRDGSVTTLTAGDWSVRHVVSIDEDARRVVFTGGGREPGSDPYLQELYSVSLDGGELTAITSDGRDHACAASPSGRFFVDNTSRYDVETVSVLRDRSGAVVLDLERADAAALYAAGWTPPERVVVKAADGETDLYCAIYKPHDFDPSATYPVVEEIYPGPQISTAPLRFPLSGGVLTGERNAAGFAALGFVVVAVDGRGSALRGKDFQDFGRRGPEGEFVGDHVAAIKQLGATRPWMDLDRVGIYGHSAGGYASTRCMLLAPEFYKVAVSSAGSHDNRPNHVWWAEKFFGSPDEFDFAAQSNPEHAAKLRGKLLLVHGEMDDNATPHLTMRLVDALIKANKDFDLLIVPNADHRLMIGTAYWLRRRWDYFVQHLMGEPPPAYQIADIPIDPELLAP